MRGMFSLFVCGVGLAAYSLGSGSPSHASEIGAVSAVNRNMDGTPPAGERRQLQLGNGVFQNEVIETSAVGSGQLLFLDQTSLTVAPRANLVLDRYVYDPDQGTGEIALSLARGTLRFIGGKITKSNTATVVTPTATVGIRGGMTIIEVADDGATRVVQMAGEYTTITDEKGRQIFLSRPGISADVTSNTGVKLGNLVSASELAGYFVALEGRSDGGAEVLLGETGTATVRREAPRLAELNSEVDGGADDAPVSTSGERSVDDAAEQITEETTIADAMLSQADTRPLEPGDVAPLAQEASIPEPVLPPEPPEQTTPPDQTPVPPPPAPAVFVPPTSGSASVPANPGNGAGRLFTFEAIAQGSLIGSSDAGQRLTVPILEDGTGVVTFDFGDGTAELVDIDFNGVTQDPALLAGATFSDLERNFFYSEFTTGPLDPQTLGAAFFGDPSPNQARRMTLDDGSVPVSANTVDVWTRQPPLFLDPPPPGVPENIFLLANGGLDRFQDGETSGRALGSRWLGAELFIEDGPDGQNSSLTTLVRPVLTNGSGGPRLAAGPGRDAFTTRLQDGAFSIFETRIGTMEDSNGNTVFGPDDDYLVIGSTFITNNNDAGLRDSENRFGGTQVDLIPGQFGVSTGRYSTLFERDPQLSEIVARPAPLNQDLDFRRFPGMDGFMTGMAVCDTGNCGVHPVTGEPTGFYDVRNSGAQGQSVSLDLPDEVIQNDSRNAVFLFARLSDGNESGIVTNLFNNANPDEFNFQVAGSDTVAAYIDDNRFLSNSPTSNIFGGSFGGLQFAIASSGLVGDGGIFPAGVDTAPEFLRWGWWSALVEPTDAVTNTTRRDLFHLGNFVFGNESGVGNLPDDGIARFSGLAVGTEADFTTSTTRVLGGSFDLTFDFGASQGTFGLQLPGAGIDATVPVSSIVGSSFNYSGTAPFGIQGAGTISAQGDFYSGGGSPIAATAGQFDVVDVDANRQITGIFGGDSE